VLEALVRLAFSCYKKIVGKQAFSVTKKSRGRPKGRSRPETAPVRIPVQILVAVDGWISAQSERLTRPEAIGRLIELGLSAPAKIPIIVASRDAASLVEGHAPTRAAAGKASKSAKVAKTASRGKTRGRRPYVNSEEDS
jgi:hypothetical protein